MSDLGRQDEILQLMFWMHGEKLGDKASQAQLQQFLQASDSDLADALVRLTERGLLSVLRGCDTPLFRLTEAGIREGKRRFTEEFAPYLGRESHVECADPDCDCHSPEFNGVCKHLND